MSTLKINFSEDTYTMTCEVIGYDTNGKATIEYSLTSQKHGTIFEGRDLKLSPLEDEDSPQACVVALSFLTVKKEDVESEYFDNYTPEQLKFSNSSDCELISYYNSILEENIDEILEASKEDEDFLYTLEDESGNAKLDIEILDRYNWEVI